MITPVYDLPENGTYPRSSLKLRELAVYKSPLRRVKSCFKRVQGSHWGKNSTVGIC